jgi:hypothetical protein
VRDDKSLPSLLLPGVRFGVLSFLGVVLGENLTGVLSPGSHYFITTFLADYNQFFIYLYNRQIFTEFFL